MLRRNASSLLLQQLKGVKGALQGQAVQLLWRVQACPGSARKGGEGKASQATQHCLTCSRGPQYLAPDTPGTLALLLLCFA